MNEATCSQCTHFRQYYIIDSSRCTPVYCGHCTYLRVKKRRPDMPACSGFAARANPEKLPDRAGVIDFLTTDILEQILQLKMPPLVENRMEQI